MVITIREATLADAPAMADIVIDSNEGAFRGRVPDQCLASLTREESAANWRRTLGPGGLTEGRCLYVAETTAGQVVGCALGGPNGTEPHFRGEVYLLNVLPAHQSQGIGRQLMAAIAGHLAHKGITSLLVRTLMVNPYRPFYERLGGQYLRQEPYDWNGIALVTAVYGWADTATLRHPPFAGRS
jgi:GNAT superfamily N-acetyltransferase